MDKRCQVGPSTVGTLETSTSKGRAMGGLEAGSGGEAIFSKTSTAHLFSIKRMNCVIAIDLAFFQQNRNGWKWSRFYEQPDLTSPAVSGHVSGAAWCPQWRTVLRY